MSTEDQTKHLLWNIAKRYEASAGKLDIPAGADFVGAPPSILPTSLSYLGNRQFCLDLNLKFPLVSGAMANGIASTKLVWEMASAGMLGFLGSAGLSLQQVENAIDELAELSNRLGQQPGAFGFNLIHSPNEPHLEDALVDLYLKRDVRIVEAAAFMQLSLPLLRYRLSGIYRDQNGFVQTKNHLIAKVSRLEVASQFFSPAPDKMLEMLVSNGCITSEQALMAKEIPVAQDITAEADSGGHTDNRPAFALVPAMQALKNRLQAEFSYRKKLRVGVAGGIGTPESAAAAFSMGAAYIVTGSINQACIESGSSDAVRKMLCEATSAEVAMAPSADMFEMGIKVQVLKRGTMFPMRANKLYDLYTRFKSLEELPEKERSFIETHIFKRPLWEEWAATASYFSRRDPSQVVRAEKDPKHQMALLFRSYLGQSSNWANEGKAERKMDFQIWCGPAMGAFNEWSKGSFLENPEERRVKVVSLNILMGAAVILRKMALQIQGVRLDTDDVNWRPLPEHEIMDMAGG